MGIFSRNQGENRNNITSVVLIEQTQKYKNKTSWGLSFSNSAFGDPIAMSQTVPDGTELTFSITYKNGRKKVLKVMSGTAMADRLLQMALDPDKRNTSSDRIEGKSGQNAASAEGKPLIKLGKNQLPQGRYIIGKDLPDGTFDFTWVWGEGYLSLYKTDENTTLGNNLYLENVGIAHEYQYRQCLHLQCAAGNMLIIGGNLVVEISRSPRLDIDL
jgi:hypothetical protein